MGKRPRKELPLPLPVPFPRPWSSLFLTRLSGEELELNWDVEELLLCAHDRKIHGKFQGGKVMDAGMWLSSGQGNTPRKIQTFPAPNPSGSTFSHLFPTKHSGNFRNGPNSTCKSLENGRKFMEYLGMTLEMSTDTKSTGKWAWFRIPTPLEKLRSVQDIREQRDGVTQMSSLPCSQHSRGFLECTRNHVAVTNSMGDSRIQAHPMGSSFPRNGMELRRSRISQDPTPGNTWELQKDGKGRRKRRKEPFLGGKLLGISNFSNFGASLEDRTHLG